MASNVAKASVSATGVVSATGCTYYGFTFRNTSSSATATIRLWDDSAAATGKLLDTIQLAASESAREYYGPQGVRASVGIYAELVSGTIEGGVRHG